MIACTSRPDRLEQIHLLEFVLLIFLLYQKAFGVVWSFLEYKEGKKEKKKRGNQRWEKYNLLYKDIRNLLHE